METKPVVLLTKGRYKELCNALTERFGNTEQVEAFLSTLKEVLKYDPSISAYTKEKADSIRAYRAKKKEEGVSTYVSSGVKACRDKKRAEKIAKGT